MPPLVDWLRERDDDTLAELLRLRPDLGVPPPSDLTVLATRAGVRVSVQRACDDLDTVGLAVLEALAAAGAHTTPVPATEVRRLLGPELGAADPDGALAALRARALVWGRDDELSLTPAAREVLPRYPGGLGRPAAGPAGSTALPDLLAAVTPEQQRVLDALAAGPPIGRSRAGGDPRSPVGELLAAGLLLRVDDDTVELPRQVGLALRGDRPMGSLAIRPPTVDTVDRGAEVVDATAAVAATELVRLVEKLVACWGATPPPVLRSGGLGVRDLRRLARELGSEERVAALVVEVAAGADLIAEGDGIGPEWLPTTAADVWATAGPEHRWAQLAGAWLDLPRVPGLVGTRDDADRPVAPLSGALRRPQAARDRRRILAALAEPAPGMAVAEPSALADLLAWRAPRRGGRLRDDLVRWTLAEATTLGVVALDAVAAAGRALLDDPGRAGAVLRAALPDPVDRVLLQADLTAIAPGPLAAGLERELNLIADVESAGGATVYRFTEASVRRALDAGRSAADLHALLAERSATPVPQALDYLVDDVARRHGRLRGAAAASFLRSDDAMLIAEVMAHACAGELELRRIAPTVAISPLALVDVLAGLRSAGFSPAAEDTGGAVLDLSEQGRRTAPRRRGERQTAPATPGDERLRALVARARAGEAVAGARPGPVPTEEPGANLAVLRAAVAESGRVWIGFVDAAGTAGERILEPRSVGGGVLEGRDATDGALHRMPLHRITAVAPAG